MPFYLEVNEPVSVGIPRLILEEIANIQKQLTDPEIDRDIGVHEARKACKRIRAALRLVRDEIGEIVFKRENIRFRDAARKLAAARDSWVKIAVLDSLVNSQTGDLPDDGFYRFRQRLVEEYKASLAKHKRDESHIARIVKTLREGAERMHQLPIHRDGFDVLEGGLQRTYRRGCREWERSKKNPTPENFHEWRKRVKYLWHQVDILADMKPDVLVKLAEDLHELADVLGNHHDLVVLRWTALEYGETYLDEDALKALVDLINHRLLELESQARILGKQLYHEPILDFVGKMKRYWQDWRTE